MNYNLICIFICTPVCANLSILVKSGCHTSSDDKDQTTIEPILSDRKKIPYLQIYEESQGQ
jgi:hypothetical protein